MWTSLLLLWWQVTSLALFLIGFFPVKRPLERQASEQDVVKLPGTLGEVGHDKRSSWLDRSVGQLAVVLVDALRADFVFNHDELQSVGVDYSEAVKSKERPRLSYLREMLTEGKALGAVSKATPPTVTLPRIKALTTGSIPGFVDVVLNFGSSSLSEDNLVAQWSLAGRNVTFFGDDTWIKLFPEQFIRWDGTHSFFVADYTEVDVNVTRHLAEELPRNDWDVMILHYLGLDHIGHLVGPDSHLVGPKLREMDHVISTIYAQLSAKPWKHDLPPMVLVLGDHGMSEGGSHGGASVQEVMTPVIALGPNLHGRSRKTPTLANQQDLVPTLAALTGVPIPQNNIGQIITEFLHSKWTRAGKVADAEAYWYNAKQVARVLEKNLPNHGQNPGYLDLGKAESLLLKGEDLTGALVLMKSALSRMALDMADNLLEYNLFYMYAAVGNMLLLLCLSWSMTSVRPSWMILFEVLKVLSLGSTSFVEEQHQTFYFLAGSSLWVILYQRLKQSYFNERAAAVGQKGTPARATLGRLLDGEVASVLFLALPGLRIGRKWNQTGDKWAHLPDISDWLCEPSQLDVFVSLHVMSLVALLSLTVARRMHQRHLGLTAAYVMVFCHNCAKGSFGATFQLDIFSPRGVIEARAVYTFCLVYFLYEMRREKSFKSRCRSLLDSLLPVLVMLSHPRNSTLFVGQIVIDGVISRAIESRKGWEDSGQRWLIQWTLGMAFFFCQGNSNSLATVDLGAGFVGLSADSMVTSTALIFLNTFSAPIVSTLLFHTRHGLQEALPAVALVTAFELLYFLLISTTMRYHLFVWTVFSPKLLYQGCSAIMTSGLLTFLAGINAMSD